MKKFICCSVLLVMFVWGGTAWAAYFSESLIYTGPPDYEEVYDEDNGPTYASGSAYGKDAEARADWWALGGRLSNTWNNGYQGWIYVFVDFYKEFEVTAAGPASINFSWDGLLQVSGDSAYDEAYYLYADASVGDDIPAVNDDVYWYEELNSVGILPVYESTTFNYVFGEEDVGDIFEISLTLQTQVGLAGQSITFTEGDSLEFDSDFYNTLKIDSISGGIEAVDGPPPPIVPIPGAVWLLGSGIIGMVGIRRKFKK